MSTLLLDTRHGGLGDVWMRLAGLFSLAALLPDRTYEVMVPTPFLELGIQVFGSRLRLKHDCDGVADYTFSSLGARSLLGQVIRGQRFVTPYSSFASTDARRHPFANGLNQAVIRRLDATGRVRSPRSTDIHRYQAYSDIAPFAEDGGVSYSAFLQQAKADFGYIRHELHQPLRLSTDFSSRVVMPLSEYDLLVFPSGTSRQCIPAQWAATHLRHATHAFFYKDPLKLEYEQLGLTCVSFFTNPSDMIALALRSKWCISTDTFSSHLLQYLGDNSTILLTELTSARVVSPFFGGRIVNSQAPCFPCRKVVRSAGSLCQAGHNECLNWTYAQYAADTLTSIATGEFRDH